MIYPRTSRVVATKERSATAQAVSLRLVKLIHTVVWAFFATCVVAIPVMAWRGALGLALLFIGFVCVEVVVLAVNAWRCPLTPIAARYTDDRQPNFDIFLPVWLARWNKEIFGTVFVVGVLLTLARWLGWFG